MDALTLDRQTAYVGGALLVAFVFDVVGLATQGWLHSDVADIGLFRSCFLDNCFRTSRTPETLLDPEDTDYVKATAAVLIISVLALGAMAVAQVTGRKPLALKAGAISAFMAFCAIVVFGSIERNIQRPPPAAGVVFPSYGFSLGFAYFLVLCSFLLKIAATQFAYRLPSWLGQQRSATATLHTA